MFYILNEKESILLLSYRIVWYIVIYFYESCIKLLLSYKTVWFTFLYLSQNVAWSKVLQRAIYIAFPTMLTEVSIAGLLA